MKSLTQRLKRLKHDERGVSPVVGFVLIFALIMIVFTLYQSSVVPAQNEEVEFTHSQTVEGQMSGLNDAIQSASADGASRSQTVAIGMNYPTRALAINPGSPAGTLQTSDPHPISITGVDVAGSEYWDGSSNPDLETESLSYAINYNVLQSGPEFTIANGALSKSYDSGTVAVSDSAAILPRSQKQIDLTLFGGNYQENGLTANPTAEPISTSTQYLHFTSNERGDPNGLSKIGLDDSLTTAQCQEKWTDLIGEDFNEIDGDDDNSPNSAIDCSNHVMKLAPNEPYTLRISKIGFGDTSGLSADAKEVVPTETDKITAPGTATLDATVGEGKSFTVLVRDKYGNPVSDAEVNIDQPNTDPDRSRISPSESPQPKTNDQGKVTFTYTPTSTGSKEITVSSPKADSDLKATYEFDITDDDNSDNNDLLGSGDITNGYALEQSIVTINKATYKKSKGPVTFTFENQGDTPMEAVAMQVNGGLGHKNHPIDAATFNGEQFTFNGESVNLTTADGGLDHTFTVPDSGTKKTKPNLDNFQNDNENNPKLEGSGFLIVTVKYRYTYEEDGKDKTGTETATYAVSVNKIQP